ncbi:MAG: tRNA uridine-5-carboxymethylaminomethyl(34) synthesis enzyme MnmG, partial [Nostoc sp.]
FTEKQANITTEKQRLQVTRVKEYDQIGIAIASDTQQLIKGSITLNELLRRPGFHYVDLDRFGLGNPNLNRAEKEGAEIEIKYSGYLARQQNQI